MYPIHNILVAIKEPGAKSHPAVAKAAVLAAALDAKLQLFHAIDVPAYPDLAAVDNGPALQMQRRRQDHCQLLLERIAAPLRRTGLSVTTAAEWDFPRHEAIIRAATRFGANLIIAADHATVHRAPWLLRYTDWELVRTSPVPVLLVKSPRPYRSPVVLAGLDPAQAFAKPATLDQEILHFSSTLADALQGTVHAVYAYVPVPANLSPLELSNPGELEKRLVAAEGAAFDALSDKALPLGISKSNLHVVGRHPVDAILEVATQTRSQIVALGSISRGGVDRFLIGNTAEALVDRLQCDVLIVKPPEFRHTVARAPRGAHVVPLPFPAGVL